MSTSGIGVANILWNKPYLINVIVVLFSSVAALVQGGCTTSAGTPICCRGKQSTCCGYTYDVNGNRTSSTQHLCPTSDIMLRTRKAVKTCFCDEFCTTTKDCCPDYRTLCHKPIIDCMVSEWGPWSECDRQCGQGVSVRRRRIIQPPSNGGQHCPVLEESKPCQGYRCVSRRVGRSGSLMLPFVRQARAEVAHLLPSTGDVPQITRRWDMRWDERRKLYLGKLIKQNKTEKPEPDPYCAVYEITHANKACLPENLLWQLMAEQSLNGFNYRRSASSNPMHSGGLYPFDLHAYRPRISRRERRWDAFPTPIRNTVILGPEMDSQNPWKYTWINHGALIAKGRQICVTCYPGYMREDLGFRCSGSGLLNVETRWRAVQTADCHGRFRMLTMPQRACTCDAEATSFIFI
ncbi:unnamed protein product [Dicrocoelium dendriticum]|nr:unnamed protein product [Dicrocoelium dendriticum]